MNHRLRMALVVLFAVAVTACGSSEEAGSPTTTPTSATPATTSSTVAPVQQEPDVQDEVDVSDAPQQSDEAEPGTATAESTANADSTHPDIIAARATREDGGTWRFDVTVSSPYDTPDRYADAWRVLGPDGTELGVRILTHDHASEQPFTRSQGGIEIPDGTVTVTIEGRDLANGWGGGTLDLELPAS